MASRGVDGDDGDNAGDDEEDGDEVRVSAVVDRRCEGRVSGGAAAAAVAVVVMVVVVVMLCGDARALVAVVLVVADQKLVRSRNVRHSSRGWQCVRCSLRGGVAGRGLSG
ncbi:hypothetical protein MRB53_040771 [Persea americana]|nr:hypothetical protein MRB53_040771 [Persea americana]